MSHSVLSTADKAELCHSLGPVKDEIQALYDKKIKWLENKTEEEYLEYCDNNHQYDFAGAYLGKCKTLLIILRSPGVITLDNEDLLLVNVLLEDKPWRDQKAPWIPVTTKEQTL